MFVKYSHDLVNAFHIGIGLVPNFIEMFPLHRRVRSPFHHWVLLRLNGTDDCAKFVGPSTPRRNIEVLSATITNKQGS